MTRCHSIPLLLLAMICTPGCNKTSGPASTETSSTKFSTLSEKVEFLEQYVVFRRTYEDLDFVISYVNNSGGMVPAPADWDIRAVAQVPPAELAQWTKGMKPTSSPDIDWLSVLPDGIDHSGVSEWFQSGNRLVGVDRKNAIIVYRNLGI